MIGYAVDLSAFDALRGAWDAAAVRALRAAMTGEAFRLKSIVSAELAAGVGPETEPLTRAEEKTPTPRALSAFRGFVGYQVEETAAGIAAKIGFAYAITRARSPSGRRVQLLSLFEGGTHAITREDQRRIAANLRRRRAGAANAGLRRMGLSARHGRTVARRAPLPRLLIPRVGRMLVWPRRDWAAKVVAREGRQSGENVARLFSVKMAGLRFDKRWWGAS